MIRRVQLCCVAPIVLMTLLGATAFLSPPFAGATVGPQRALTYDGPTPTDVSTTVQVFGSAIRPARTPASDAGYADLSGDPVATNTIDDVGVAGTRATVHGSERLSQAGFTDDLVAQTKSALSTTQADGAAVYVREVSPGRFDFIVEGERGVITAHRGWSQKAIDRLAANYGWEGWPP